MFLNFLKMFTLGILTSGLAIFGLAAPAHAASMTGVTAVTTTPLVAGQPNAAAIVITFTTPSGMPGGSGTNSQINVRVPGTTGLGNYTACGSAVSVVTTPAVGANGGPTAVACLQATDRISLMLSGGTPPSVTWTVTFAPNTLTMPSVGNGLDVVIDSMNPPTANFDNGNVLIPFAASQKTVTFNSNGGAGTLAAQTASSSTALTANAFSKAGFTFNGWNTAADGTGTAYAEGASYAFTADATLYAQWKATLANTGFDGAPYLLLGNLLGVLGVALLLMATRRQTR